jgi:hypothetical protein
MNLISISQLWPEGISIIVAAIYLVGMANLAKDFNAASKRIRLLSFIGLCATSALIFLGLISPYYGIIAIPAIPAPILFVIAIFRPTLISNGPKLRIYLAVCVSASALASGFQLFWDILR